MEMKIQKPWYHFWNPMSGLFGGLIMGTILAIVAIVAILISKM